MNPFISCTSCRQYTVALKVNLRICEHQCVRNQPHHLCPMQTGTYVFSQMVHFSLAEANRVLIASDVAIASNQNFDEKRSMAAIPATASLDA